MYRASLLFAAALCATWSTPAAAGVKGWGTASDYGRDALAAVALGLPAVQGDWAGALQAGGSMGAAFVATTGLKEAFPETRPDGSDRKSFPSGHTATAFSAAATIQNRYGWEAGIPAQLIATFVGIARVKARKHHWYDVAVGAAIGESAGFLITSKRNDTVRILPWGDTKGGGFALAARF